MAQLKDSTVLGDVVVTGTLYAQDGTTTVPGLLSTADKIKLDTLNSGAEVNQNAFSNVVVGSTTIAADTKTDTLTLIAGTNIALNPDAANDNVTIALTGTVAVANGGTGKTSGRDAANYFMNALDTGSSTPVDADYYISQYVNGGTTTTTYHRRPMSALWSYISGKINSVLGINSTKVSNWDTAYTNNHTHSNKTTLDGISSTDITNWNNKSDFSGSYADLTNVPSSFTPSSHAHGNITNAGDITTTATIASGDRIVINDESASKVTNSSITFGTSTSTYLNNSGTWTTPPNDDTKNTAGSTDTSSKIFLVGATSQAANPQTYSDNQVYATNGQLDMNKARVAEAVTVQYNSTNKCLEFVFA